jgi:hypothetical protein
MPDLNTLLAMMQPKLGVPSPLSDGPVFMDRFRQASNAPAPNDVHNAMAIQKTNIPGESNKSYSSQVDSAFFNQLLNRQNQVAQMQQEADQLKNYQPGFQDANLKPLLAFADQLAGTNGAAAYSAPTDKAERTKRLASLTDNIMKSQNSIGDDQIAYLKEKANEQKMNKLMAGVKSPGQDALDRKFAADYEDWNATGGYSTAQRHLEAIQSAIDALNSDPSLTGTKQQLTPDGLRKISNPKSVAVQQQIENAVMGSLRATLGPQFTENEGKRILNLAYDPALPASVNAQKLKALLQEQATKAMEKETASKYFSRTGTLRGYTPGNLTNIQAPIAPPSQAPQSKPKTVMQNGHTFTLNEATGQYE